MSDEIDIEEHDVMDNPSIKRIFPDLSVIKKEINQYYDEAALPESTFAESNQEMAINRDFNNQDNTIMIHSDEKRNNTSFNIPKAIDPQKNIRYFHENVIILGTKPNVSCQKKDYIGVQKREPKLIMKDISSFLNNCKRYCKDCCILFPKANIFNLHRYNIHIQKNYNMNSNPKLYNDCNICNTNFSTRFNLIRHLKYVHGKFGTKNNTNNKKVLIGNGKSELAKGHPCFHCQQLFPTPSSLIEHLYDAMKPKSIENGNRYSSSTIAKEAGKKDNLISRSKYNSKSENVSTRRSSENVKNKRNVNGDHKEQDYRNYKHFKAKVSKCSEKFGSKRELEYHIKSIHRQRSSFEKAKMNKKLNKTNQCLKEMLYQCFICSKYNLTLKFYSRHMINDHNLKEVAKVKKVPFDSQCKFCTSKLSNMKYYNVHIYKYHKMLLRKAMVPREKQGVKRNTYRLKNKYQFALNSILYQCMKCDIFFLTTNAAKSHLDHMKSLDNWKCSVCQRIFKKKDKALHLKQHLVSLTFTVYYLSEAAFSRVLYKCSKCTVHYSEEQYSLHYTKCDTETPDSLYCKSCDILINRNDMDFHELNHTDNKMLCSDFTIIESEVLDSTNITFDESFLDKSKLAMAYCHTCKCFINMQLTHKVHIEDRCGHMLKTVCKDCGLLLTMKSHSTHKKIHEKKEINLQHYLFYDLKTQKRILPPIPDFPSCPICGVHFLRKSAILIHSCNRQDFLTCNICLTKFTEHAYKLHTAYHNYSIQKENKEMKDTEVKLPPTDDAISYTDPNSCVLDDSTFANLFLYTCKSCHITLNTYDGVVEHCQDHYYCRDIQINTQKCKYCNLTFGSRDYDIHDKLHTDGKYNTDSVTVVEFDPFYFRYSNDFWIKHIFAYVADEQIQKILNNSMYKYECRLKLEEVQSGCLSMTFYKCAKCQVYIEPRSLYLHVENSKDSSCAKLRKHPCSLCGLIFISRIDRLAHEKEHKGVDINLKSYKIILFNKIEHETLNNIMFEAINRYIKYQCRNCEQAVDKFQRKTHNCDVNNLKMCLACGLLIHNQDYDLHFIRHEELEKFKTENMIVVLFGNMLYPGKKELKSTFSGTKYDYTIYKCNNCKLCLRTKLCTHKHVCVSENSKCKCAKCGLYFSKLELKDHSKQHESDLEFDEYNINIITFDAPPPKHVNPKEKEPIAENNETQKEIEQAEDKNGLIKVNKSNYSDKRDKIYKCSCGLHFLEELNAQRHANNCNPRMKISKQTCFKCDLLFTPGELFNHLLKHHCDKKLQYKFDIVIVSKKDDK